MGVSPLKTEPVVAQRHWKGLEELARVAGRERPSREALAAWPHRPREDADEKKPPKNGRFCGR